MAHLTGSKYIGVVHDSVMEADTRQDVLSGAAVIVEIELVVFLGHVNAVAVIKKEKTGSREGSVIRMITPASIRMQALAPRDVDERNVDALRVLTDVSYTICCTIGRKLRVSGHRHMYPRIEFLLQTDHPYTLTPPRAPTIGITRDLLNPIDQPPTPPPTFVEIVGRRDDQILR